MRLTREEWQTHASLWEESGLSRAAYCREAGITYQTFVGWLRRLRVAGAAEAETEDPNEETAETGAGFLELALPQRRDDTPGVLLAHRGFTVRFPGSLDSRWVASCIREIVSC